ncbi:tRNA (adenosine(37)-N6)-threonylcarbamoyltransferase complex dimerization subunit type 1 TsaB [Qipengyuania sp. ASV99]|uniref:tRNA (adenosine(37)-N6)-threonylcarbamoyltransferase complex dimerization subunit type 1 TsaB n=1 Tax=Qipengyuania sp. ASV99 TaxID=3399681 RepID=UPI003A4C7A8C
MRILAIETASEACSVALFDGPQLLAREHHVLGRGHAESLVPMIESLPDRGRADRIVVSLGPGSFTGVRIGIAAARALGYAWSAEVFGYPTLALVAAQAWQPALRPVTVCMNGGHGEWFVQDFIGGLAHSDAVSLTPDAALAAGAQTVIAGNRAREFAELFGDDRLALDLLPDAGAVPLLPEALFSTDLVPTYVRSPDAVPQVPPASSSAMAERR